MQNNYSDNQDNILDNQVEVMTEEQIAAMDYIDEKFNSKDDRKTTSIKVAIDSEYDNKRYISLQGQVQLGPPHSHTFSFIVVDKKFKNKKITKGISDYLNKNPEVYVTYADFGNRLYAPLVEALLGYLKGKNLLHHYKRKFRGELFFYYTPKDLTAAFGRNIILPFYLGKQKVLSQNRNIVGRIHFDYGFEEEKYSFDFRMKDLIGLHPGSLATLAATVGEKKMTGLEEFKSDMGAAFNQHPVLFLEYGLNDAQLLFKIFKRKIEACNNILVILGITDEDYFFTESNFPLTVGTIVYRIWSAYLKKIVFNEEKFLILAMVKQGILNQMFKNYFLTKEYFALLNKFTSFEAIHKYSKEHTVQFNKMYDALTANKALLYRNYQYASVNYLISETTNKNEALLGLTTGGRTVNERPSECTINYGADIDIASAYGSILKQLIYPIGRPRILSNSANETELLTLGAFMDKYYDKLKLGLYKIVVSGALSFSQDILLSKLAPQDMKQYKIVYDKEDVDDAAIDVPFVLLRQEIYNSNITKEVWDLLKKVCSNKELGEIRGLKVQSAIFWLDSDRVDSLEELRDIFYEDKGEYSFSKKQDRIVDTRTHKWFGVELYKFINPLLDERKKRKKSPLVEDQAIQEAIKLVINTYWGLVTSPYFEMSNTVCSEIVTSTIRCSVWLLSKAFNTYQSITDGGQFSLVNVSFIKESKSDQKRKIAKPGLEAFSSYTYYKEHRSIRTGRLGDIDWAKYFEDKTPNTDFPFNKIDELAQLHLEKFWANYDIPITFNVENKVNNIFKKGAYMLKAHYAFLVWDSDKKDYTKIFFKIRGFKVQEEVKHLNPMYHLLIQLLLEPEKKEFVVANEGKYTTIKLLKLKAWRKSLVRNQNNKLVSSYGEDKLPGDAVELNNNFRLNNLHTHIDTLQEYKTRINRISRTKTKIVKGVKKTYKIAMFEQFLANEGIYKTVERMVNDDLSSR